jgi:hypothetical protein
MSSYTMIVNILGNEVRAETSGCMVSLTDIERAGRLYRLQNNMPDYQLAAFLESKLLKSYIVAAAEVWGLPEDSFLIRSGRGKTARTMAHISIGILLAEQISPHFHATVHKVFIEGKLLEFRDLGGTEFKELNLAIDSYLPERELKESNKGIFISVAKLLRAKILGEDQDWQNATVSQTHKRYDYEKQLSQMLRLGVIKNYDHLKDLIKKL